MRRRDRYETSPAENPAAEAEKGAAVGGVTGAAAGALAGAALGPVMAVVGAVVGGVVGAVGTGVVVAATDTAGEETHTERIQKMTDASIERNSLEDDTPLSVAHSWVNEDVE
jgi:phage tail tape-measure protein